MSNRELDAAWHYHDATKHSYRSVRTNPHYLDWESRPLPFKIYSSLSPIPLPPALEPSSVPALAAIARTGVPADDVIPDLRTLSRALFLSGGITKRKTYPGGEQFFRAASCTGALYEIELYVVCQDLPGLAAGVYHFNPADRAIRQLRRGDYRGILTGATAGEPAVLHAPLTIICTATYWRNAWKYQGRTYRHFGWDNGTLLANTLAACVALRLPARVVCGFVDAAVNELLSLDSEREVAFSMVAVGHVARASSHAPALEPLALETVPLSATEVDYPIMREMHAASSLETPEQVAAWRSGGAPASSLPAPGGATVPLRPGSDAEVTQDSTEQVILRRGSTRRFKRGASWSFGQLSDALCRATQGIPADFLNPEGALLNDLYIIVHAVEGLKPGAYVLHRHPWGLELLKEGDFRDEAGYLGLEQTLPADASFVVFFLADLHAILERFGNRGYRVVQLEAGILGGKLYLAAYAQRLGASGLTFYDDDVVKFFSPHARGKSAIFCMTLGKSVKLVSGSTNDSLE